MAEKEDKGLIGFDPLAWMNDDSTETDTSKNQAETNVGNKKKDEVVAETEDEVNHEGAEIETLSEQMTEQNQNEGIDDSKIILDVTLNIQNVAELYERLLKQLESQNTIEIDASAVKSIDTATLQLLIILKQTAIKLHKDVIIDFPSDKFIEAAELLGLSEMLGVDHAAAGFF